MQTLTTSSLILAAALAASAHAGQEGEVLWRFELGSGVTSAHVAVAADGTIYTSDNAAFRAVNPDGTPKWDVPALGGVKAIDILPSGLIVTALDTTVYALEPGDGGVAWSFSWEGGYDDQVAAGPNVGPDGNVYAVSGLDGDGGIGVFSLTPAGALRWSTDAEPGLAVINGGAKNNANLTFTEDRLFFEFHWVNAGLPGVFGFDFDGNQTNYFTNLVAVPSPSPDGNLIVGKQCCISSVDPKSEGSNWDESVGSAGLRAIAGADGAGYSAGYVNEFVAVSSAGQLLWTTDGLSAGKVIAVSDTSGLLFGEQTLFGSPGVLTAIDTGDGSLAWDIPLLTVNGANEFLWTDVAAFSPDGTVLYFTTRFGGNAEPGALYAVRFAAPAPRGCAPDLSGDGVVSSADLNMLLSAFGCVDACTMDLTGDGAVGSADLNEMLAMFGQACD